MQDTEYRIQRKGFTLIELLVVIAIMGILAVIAVPTLQTLTRKGVKTAVPALSSTMRLARQYAITHRTWVWVVFPDTDASLYSGDPGQVVKALRAYAVIARDRESGALEYVTDWRYLPEGVYFDEDETYKSGVTVFNSYSTGNETDFPFPGDADSDRSIPAVLFKPNGHAYRFSRPSGKWTDGLTTQVPFTLAYMPVNTNNGTVTPPVATSPKLTVIRVRNKTGQFDVVYDEL